MEKGAGKNQKSRFCLLATLSAIFWFFLLYFHLVVLGGSIVDDSDSAQFNHVSINAESSLISRPITTSPPISDIPHEKGISDDTNLIINQPSYAHRKPVTQYDDLNSMVTQPSNAPSRPESHQNADIPLGLDISDSTNLMVTQPTTAQSSPVTHQKVNSTRESEIYDHTNFGITQPGILPVNNLTVNITRETYISGNKNSNSQSKPSTHSKMTNLSTTNTHHELENFLFMRALRTAENKSDPCGGRYIYVHDLPPRFNEDMLKECRTLSLWTNMCKFTRNAGLGPPLEHAEGVFSNIGWYATNQFAVDVIFGNRMKQYECLTRDSSLAAAIFVPFYAGFDVARYLWGYNTSVRDSASFDLVDWLVKRPEWKIMGGKDHFLVAGRITWDFRRLSDEDSDWGNKLLFLPAARNMSMLVVEASPWHANDFGIPYPTYFHPAKDADVFVWQERMRKLDRKWLFCFAGAPRPGDPKSIRGQIIDQCKKSNMGKLLECDFGESKCHSPGSIMQMFQSSLFCLQPQGDSYTRRSAFDSILAGCIPVFFHPGSAYTQYTWHLPKNYSKYSVFIPEDDIRKKNMSIEQRLSQISPEQVKILREEVISLIPRLIYADPRSKLETLKDAFDVSVQAVIHKVTKLRREIIEDRVDRNFIEELSWKYALLDEGQYELLPHEWDPFFSKPKAGNADSNGSSAEVAKNSWKNEKREKS